MKIRTEKHRITRSAILIGIPALLLLIFAILLLTDRKTVEIRLLGEPEMRIALGEPYREAGAEAVYRGKHFHLTDKKLEAVPEGSVDTSAPGIFLLRYRASYRDHTGTAERMITVYDDIPPVITLKGNADTNLPAGSIYQEEGFTVSDNSGEDLQAFVIRTESPDCIRYEVSDSSGNRASAERHLHYIDTKAPVITLRGSEEVVLPAGSRYEEEGFTAKDDVDGDITADVIRTEEENGIRYEVSDRAGNRTSVFRSITFRKPQDPGKKVIYLTFDDGPSPYTQQLLDVLDSLGVKATFFISQINSRDLIRQEYERGHSVGIHSVSHRYDIIYSGDEQFFEDFNTTARGIEAATGAKPFLSRFPGGSSNSISAEYNKGIMTRLTKAVTAQGYCYVDWNVSSGDGAGIDDADRTFNYALDGVKKHDVSVVLMHDIYSSSVEAAGRLIRWGLENGYTFLPITKDSPVCHHDVLN